MPVTLSVIMRVTLLVTCHEPYDPVLKRASVVSHQVKMTRNARLFHRLINLKQNCLRLSFQTNLVIPAASLKLTRGLAS